MERIILMLLEDDIKFERQFWLLQQIGWDAETVRTDNIRVIGFLLGIEISEAVIEIYSRMVERSFKLDFDRKKIKDLSKDIYVFLNGLNKD